MEAAPLQRFGFSGEKHRRFSWIGYAFTLKCDENVVALGPAYPSHPTSVVHIGTVAFVPGPDISRRRDRLAVKSESNRCRRLRVVAGSVRNEAYTGVRAEKLEVSRRHDR
jgi:hypothetical protein